jgi:hypothetical protein
MRLFLLHQCTASDIGEVNIMSRRGVGPTFPEMNATGAESFQLGRELDECYASVGWQTPKMEGIEEYVG